MVNKMNELENNIQTLSGREILFWTFLATPTLLVIAIFFMGGGHGTYLFGKLFYPIPMIISGINSRITDLASFIAIIQIPIYGLIIFLFRKTKWKLIGIIIICIHLILWLIAMVVANGFD